MEQKLEVNIKDLKFGIKWRVKSFSDDSWSPSASFYHIAPHKLLRKGKNRVRKKLCFAFKVKVKCNCLTNYYSSLFLSLKEWWGF
jgi:hypothetical protein